jgi:hypothetical protein
MNDEGKEAMRRAWTEWHDDLSEDDMPDINPYFKEGFEACYIYFLSNNYEGEK